VNQRIYVDAASYYLTTSGNAFHELTNWPVNPDVLDKWSGTVVLMRGGTRTSMSPYCPNRELLVMCRPLKIPFAPKELSDGRYQEEGEERREEEARHAEEGHKKKEMTGHETSPHTKPIRFHG
jgi:hypothetical protein